MQNRYTWEVIKPDCCSQHRQCQSDLSPRELGKSTARTLAGSVPRGEFGKNGV